MVSFRLGTEFYLFSANFTDFWFLVLFADFLNEKQLDMRSIFKRDFRFMKTIYVRIPNFLWLELEDLRW